MERRRTIERKLNETWMSTLVPIVLEADEKMLMWVSPCSVCISNIYFAGAFESFLPLVGGIRSCLTHLTSNPNSINYEKPETARLIRFCVGSRDASTDNEIMRLLHDHKFPSSLSSHQHVTLNQTLNMGKKRFRSDNVEQKEISLFLSVL